MPRLAGGPIFPRFFYYVELSKDLYKSWPTVLGHPPGPVIATCECISTFIVTYKTNPLPIAKMFIAICNISEHVLTVFSILLFVALFPW